MFGRPPGFGLRSGFDFCRPRRAILLAAASAGALLSATPAFAYYFQPGDLVISIEGGGGAGDNQASAMTLKELKTNGVSGVTTVGTLVLPQTTTVVNGVTQYAVSAEYGSSSEGTLQLSGNGQYLTIMGYGVNAAAFNANPSAYDPASTPTNTALAQSDSSKVPRVVALIGANGSVDSSTALTNVYNTNNGRAAATVDGSSFYVSGQGVKNDGTTNGIFYTVKGSSSATAIDTSTDTRDVQIVNGKLTVSRDYNGSGGTQATNISTLSGPGGTLPTSSTGVTTAQILPAGGSTGSITLTTKTANGVNNSRVGTTVYLSPENFFYASPTVLYVADSGSPKNGNAGKAGLGEGGLQKWVLVSGTWTLEYTLYAGLHLVDNSGTSGVTGLYGLTGSVSGDAVTLYATSYTIGDLDTSYLYGIVDSLSALTVAGGESFTTLLTADAGTNIKGVSFAPTPEPTSMLVLGTGLFGLGWVRRRGIG